MSGFTSPMTRARVWAVCLLAVVLPLAAHGSELQVAFDWVNADFGGTPTVTPSGSMTLDLNLPSVPTVGGASFTTAAYSSAAAWEAAIVGLSFTDSAGQTYSLSDITSVTPPSTLVWNDSDDVTPQFSTSAGNYLVPSFILANTSETLSFNTGASTLTAVGLSTNSVSSTSVSDVGYWELKSVTPVPLPGTLPLLLEGMGLAGALAWRGRRPA